MAFVALCDMFDVRAGDTLTGPNWPESAMSKFLRRGKAVWVPDGKEEDFVSSMVAGVIPDYCRNARVRRRRWSWARKHIGRAVEERGNHAAPAASADAAPAHYSHTTLMTKLTKPVLVDLGTRYGLDFTSSMSKADMAAAILRAQEAST